MRVCVLEREGGCKDRITFPSHDCKVKVGHVFKPSSEKEQFLPHRSINHTEGFRQSVYMKGLKKNPCLLIRQ